MILELPSELALQLQQMAQQQGLSEIELIDHLLRQTALEIPNKETQEAIRELEENHGIAFESVESLMRDILSDD